MGIGGHGYINNTDHGPLAPSCGGPLPVFRCINISEIICKQAMPESGTVESLYHIQNNKAKTAFHFLKKCKPFFAA